MIRTSLFSALFLVSCHAGIDFKSVDHDSLLNDQSSKIWMVDKMIVNNRSVGPYKNMDKDVIVFYDSGNFRYASLKKLAEEKAKTGYYRMDSRNGTLTLDFEKEMWEFDLGYVEPDSIYLIPSEESIAKFSIKLIPLPEL